MCRSTFGCPTQTDRSAACAGLAYTKRCGYVWRTGLPLTPPVWPTFPWDPRQGRIGGSMTHASKPHRADLGEC